MKFLYALRFLTVIPIPYKQDEDLVQMARSTLYFPLIGLMIGSLLLAGTYIFSLVFPPMLTSSLAILLWIVITGGLHLDGLADIADGLGGGRTREDKLTIMKDSRIGAFGVIALIILILLKWNLLFNFYTYKTNLQILIVPMGARWMAMNFILLFPSARKDGIGSFFKEHGRILEPVLAGIFTLSAAWFIAGITGIVVLAAVFLLLSLVSLRISRILGGLTGDVYGAMIEIAEVLILLLLPVLNIIL